MTLTAPSPAVMGMAETADIAEEWLEPAAEEAAAPLRDRKERDSHPPTAVGRAPPADPQSVDAQGTETPMMTWNSATANQPLDRPDPQEVHPREDPLAEAHLVDHPGEDRLDEEDPLEEDPLEEDPQEEARPEGPLGPLMSHRDGMSPRGPGGGLSSSRGRSRPWGARW